MFNFFKKKISQEDIASGLYGAVIRNRNQKPTKDNDGNVLFSSAEQEKLLLSHLCKLLTTRSLNKAQLKLVAFYAMDNLKIKRDDELQIQMLVIFSEIKKINQFFSDISPESNEFFKKEFLFEKDFNPIQKTLALAWYVENCKAIDMVVNQTLKEFNIAD